MKIVHVTECLAGGVLTFLVNLTSQLDDDEHVIIYGKRANTPADVQKMFGRNVSLIYWRNAQREIRPKQDLLALRELLCELHKMQDIDILQLHSSKAGVLGRVAARLLGLQKRTFYLPHGVSFARQDISNKKKNFYVLIERVADALAGTVIACSFSERNLLQANGVKNVIVINNGIEVFPKEPDYQAHEGPLVFGTVGRITIQKNPTMFNEIAKHFKGDRRVSFLWIGDGELRHEIEENEQVKVTGWVKPNEVQECLKKVDVYLSTSLWEGLPLSVLEAMNLGKPLLLSDCIGNVDTVEHGENGYLYHTADEVVEKIESLLKMSPDKRMDLGKDSYKILQDNFSLTALRKQYKAVYTKAILAFKNS